MLWPTFTQTITDGNMAGQTHRLRVGFIDANAHLVAPPKYLSYDYCLDESGNPARVVALNQNLTTDVISLDGSPTQTFPTPTHMSQSESVAGPSISCNDDKEIWTYDEQTEQSEAAPQINDGEAYDVRAGRHLRSLTKADHLPDYPPSNDTEWKIDDQEKHAVDQVTSVKVSLHQDALPDSVGSYLYEQFYLGPPLTLVYNRDGQLTPFSSVLGVTKNWNDQSKPYYWVTSGRIQGYVDDRGIWYYQESMDQTLDAA